MKKNGDSGELDKLYNEVTQIEKGNNIPTIKNPIIVTILALNKFQSLIGTIEPLKTTIAINPSNITKAIY